MNLSNMRARHPLAYVLVTSVLAITCYNVGPGETLIAMIIQTTAAATCVVALVALGDPKIIIFRINNYLTNQSSHNQKVSNEKLSNQNPRNEKTNIENTSDKKTSDEKSRNEKPSYGKDNGERVCRGRTGVTVIWVILIASG